jgi:hypothetical protein
LAASDDDGQGAGGHFLGRIVLRNVSSTPCFLDGFVGLKRLDAAHHPLPTTAVRAARRPVRLLLAPQQRAPVAYSYRENPASGESCPAATFLEVTPPDETDFLLVRSTMHPCDSMGTVTISPVLGRSSGTVAGDLQ